MQFRDSVGRYQTIAKDSTCTIGFHPHSLRNTLDLILGPGAMYMHVEMRYCTTIASIQCDI